MNPRSTSPTAVYLERFGTRFHVGDKVMQTANDYEKEIFNGDIGIITEVEPKMAN